MKFGAPILFLLVVVASVECHPKGGKGSGRSASGRNLVKRSGQMGGFYQASSGHTPSANAVKAGPYLGAFGIVGIVLALILVFFIVYYGMKYYLSKEWSQKVEENSSYYSHMSDTLPLSDYKKSKGKGIVEQKQADPKLYIGFNLGLFPNGPKAPKMPDGFVMDSAYKNANMSVDHPDSHSMSNNSDGNASTSSSHIDERRTPEHEPVQIKTSQTELSVPLRKDEIETTI